jgi:type I restriction-modification system DNA methylase subunit
MPAPQIILDLIDRFERNKDAYKSGSYNETQVRREFIDPFFEALGWDVNNTSGNAEAYKDVIHEDAVKVSGVTKAPDYSFRIGGQRKFFVEAKQPSINIKDAPAPAFQVRRYAWSGKLPLSIVTDFDEFAVYDCRIRPDQADKSDKARIKYYTYKQYAEKWDEIASIFSKDAILKGSFDKYAESTKAKRGTAEVDSAFLAEIESWREQLARNIALRNTLTVRELNDSVQRIIDRIIFLRIAEDRGIEDYGALRGIVNGANIYSRLQELFYKADERYNSGLFHFRPEKGETEPPDRLTPDLVIDDKPLKDILKTLYYPDSPYEFAVLPADILGQVYEQFLGKVIRLSSDHRAVVEDKPEVKKAGGVFYTPTYIVDYIVQNTVGKLLDGKTPKKAESLRILDPACGSGSFLLGAYQYLLDWHLKYYAANNPEKHAREKRTALYSGQGGAWHLTTAERKRILLNNIYGVDIDSQAVEVTKLSLLLKVLEDETGETLNRQRKLFHERALPNLGGNIKCGNSLIGPDFYDGKQMNLLDPEEAQRVNVFDWQAEFPEIFKAGGFDAVIGNPPYIPIETMENNERSYYQKSYPELERKFDTSIIFILRALRIINRTGLVGYISSITWQTGENFSKLRNFMFNHHGVVQVINLPFNTFADAYVDTGVYILRGQPTSEYGIYRYPKKIKINSLKHIVPVVIPANLITGPKYSLVLEPNAQKIMACAARNSKFKFLGDFTKSTQGLAASCFERSSAAKTDEWFPFAEQAQGYRYDFVLKEQSFADMRNKMSLKQFYEAEPKILIRRLINRRDRLDACYCDQQMVFKKDMNPFVLTIKTLNTKFILGIINSRLISYLYVNTSSIATKDDFRQTTLAELRRLPIPYPDITKRDERTTHDRMVQLVEQMLTLHKQLPEAKTAHEQTLLQRQIDATDRQIDKLVYELYGLTEEEIKIVEGR